MLGVQFLKAPPTTYVIQYRDGRVRREGAGLSFFYYAPTSTIVAVPMASADLPFVFQETTADFQTITVQGQITWRVVEPRVLADTLDFSADGRCAYTADGLDLLKQRLVQYAQVLTRASAQRMDLREALVSVETIAGEVLAALQESPAVSGVGVQIMGVAILSVRPTPEMSRALEAEAREALQRQADSAIYDRRNAAVEQERRIKESELSTELAVEAKRRQIREAQMNAEIAVEEQRTVLLGQRLDNDRQEADARAYALESVLKQVRDVDWRTLMAVGGNGGDARTMIAVAFRELAENAQKIGELNVTPDLLKSLLAPRP